MLEQEVVRPISEIKNNVKTMERSIYIDGKLITKSRVSVNYFGKGNFISERLLIKLQILKEQSTSLRLSQCE